MVLTPVTRISSCRRCSCCNAWPRWYRAPGCTDSLLWRARAARQIKGPDRAKRARHRRLGLQLPRQDCARVSASAHESGVPAQTRIRYRYRRLHKRLWPLTDYRCHRRCPGHCQDPHAPGLAHPRTAPVLAAVPSGPTHLPRPAQPLSRWARSSCARASTQMHLEIGELGS